ncbi:MAG: TraR/DksA family transcriptional regulator [Longimicrobiales bacterium]|nr:TraR/DksA family transcriptional regulator [Longimicrobiales bacterium]
MSHLSDDDLSQLHSELEKARARLERSLEVSREAVKPVELDQTAVGRLSRMDSLQSQSMALTLREREQVKLAHVLAALRRLDEGRYGACTDCGAPIPVGRLFIFPEAPTCQACGD